jgi:lambda family phage portal protein
MPAAAKPPKTKPASKAVPFDFSRAPTRREARSIAEQFFTLRNDYDLARPSIYRMPKPGVLPTGTGADWHIRIQLAYFSMVELAREMFRNNAFLAQGIRRMVANVVQGGFLPHPHTGDRGADKELKARWKDWSTDSRKCSMNGEYTFWDLEKLVLQHVVVDGDVFSLPLKTGMLWTVENHRVRTPVNTSRNRKLHVVHGIECDDFQRRIRYWVTKQDWEIHQAVRLVSDVERYSAVTRDKITGTEERNVFHLYRPDRLSQTRGITALAAMGDTTGMTNDLFFAQLVKAQAASCYTFLHEFAGDVVPSMNSPDPKLENFWPPVPWTRPIQGVNPGSDIYTSIPGEKITGFSPAIPNPEFFQHASLLLGLLSINLDLPLCVFLLDPTKTNFSGWRGATDQMKIRLRDFQRWLADHFHREVWRWRTRVALYEDATLRHLFDALGEQIFRHDWQAPTWPYTDPTKDVQADTMEEAACLNSPRRIMSRNGQDIDEVSREICSDNYRRIARAIRYAQRLKEKYGVEIDWHEVLAKPLPQGMTIRLTGQDPDVPEKAEGNTATSA